MIVICLYNGNTTVLSSVFAVCLICNYYYYVVLQRDAQYTVCRLVR